MKYEVSHIILTRFNLAVKFGCNRKGNDVPSNKPWLNDKYLENRFRIFEKYTFPSMRGQTDKNFKWIVMFHKDTPKIYKERIDTLSKQMEQMEIWYLDDSECENFINVIQKYIEINYPQKAIITTRIDNDDMLHNTFVETLKKDIDFSKGSQAITYENGIQYDSKSKVILNYDYVDNHFLSLYIPSSEKKEHIMSCKHNRIDEFTEERGIKKVVLRTDIPMWVEVITNTNCSNTMIWKFSNLIMPYKILSEYPSLEVKCNSKIGWCGYVLLEIVKVTYYRIVNLTKVIIGKLG